jgi:hypothetical protein
MTPVIVAAVSEMLNRPANRVSELRRQRRTMVLEAQQLETVRVLGEDTSPLAGAPDFAQGTDADDLHGNGSGDDAPIRIHGRRRSRVLHPKVWIVTGLVGFVVAAGALTLPELIFGGSVSTSHRTTFFGGGSSSKKTETSTTPTQTDTNTQTTVTETVPAQTPVETTQTETGTSTDTTTSPSPSGGAPAPGDTTTDTSTTPSGAVPPLP